MPGVVFTYYLVIEPGLYSHLGGLCDPPHAPGGLVQFYPLVRELHVWGHGFRHRHAEYAANVEPRPLARLVDGVFQRDLILAVQGLGHSARGRRERSRAVGAEVRTVGGEYADRGWSPPFADKIKVPLSGDTLYMIRVFYIVFRFSNTFS